MTYGSRRKKEENNTFVNHNSHVGKVSKNINESRVSNNALIAIGLIEKGLKPIERHIKSLESMKNIVDSAILGETEIKGNRYRRSSIYNLKNYNSMNNIFRIQNLIKEKTDTKSAKKLLEKLRDIIEKYLAREPENLDEGDYSFLDLLRDAF